MVLMLIISYELQKLRENRLTSFILGLLTISYHTVYSIFLRKRERYPFKTPRTLYKQPIKVLASCLPRGGEPIWEGALSRPTKES